MATSVYVAICSAADWGVGGNWAGKGSEVARDAYYEAQYTSWAAADVNRSRNITLGTGDDEEENFEILGDDWSGSPDTTSVSTQTDWLTDKDNGNEININTVRDGKADYSGGGFDTTAYVLEVSEDFGVWIAESGGPASFAINFYDIQIKVTGSGGGIGCIGSDTGIPDCSITINRCWLWVANTGSTCICLYTMNSSGDPTWVINCVLEGESASAGHAVRSATDAITIVNCTVTGWGDDALEADTADPANAVNNALCNNSDDWRDSWDVRDYNATDEGAGQGTNDVDISGTWDSTCFVDHSTSDWNVQDVDSPLYHAGANQNEYAYVPSVDIAGNPRPTGSDRPSIGAFEFPVAGETVVQIAQAVLLFTGQALSVNAATTISITQETMAFTGQAVNVNAETLVAIAQEAIAYTGQTLKANLVAKIDQAVMSYTGQAVVSNIKAVIAIAQAALSYTGQALAVNAATLIEIAQATMSYTGQALTVLADIIIAIAQAALSYAGQTVNVNAETVVGITNAALTFTGQVLGINARTTLQIDQGTMTYTGQSLTVLADVVIQIAQATMTYVGQSVVSNAETVVQIASAVMTYTGQALLVIEGTVILIGQATMQYTGKALNVIAGGVAAVVRGLRRFGKSQKTK